MRKPTKRGTSKNAGSTLFLCLKLYNFYNMKKYVLFLSALFLISCSRDRESSISWDTCIFSEEYVDVQQALVDSICREVAEKRNFIKKDERKYIIPTDNSDEGEREVTFFYNEVKTKMEAIPEFEQVSDFNFNYTVYSSDTIITVGPTGMTIFSIELFNKGRFYPISRTKDLYFRYNLQHE